MTIPDLKVKILTYVDVHPDCWTRDVHQAVAREIGYWIFRALMLEMEGIVSKRHSNKNLTWRLRS